MPKVAAAILTAPGTLEMAELSRPAVGEEEGIVRVEAVGICGSDVDQYARGPSGKHPVIPGHEIVGTIEEIGTSASARRGLDVGDRVAIDPFIPCGICGYCLVGSAEFCDNRRTYGGSQSVTDWPGIWGGYASHVFIERMTVLHPVPQHIGPELATQFNPLAAGIKWGVDLPGTTIGSTVVVLGSGQRGIACVIAARLAGASLIIVTGLSRDRHKLDMAVEFGADVAVDVERENLTAVVSELSHGRGVDAVIDTTPYATSVVNEAIEIVRPLGTIVMGGFKHRGVDGFALDALILKSATIKPVLGIGSDYYRRAIEVIASERLDLDLLRTHSFSLAEAEKAIGVLAGEYPDERPVNVVLIPGS